MTARAIRDLIARLDAAARRHPILAVPIAVAERFRDDGGGRWAALISYYGFLSLFPLLLSLTTVLGLVVQGDEDLQARILDSALARFPIIGAQIRENLGSLQGSVVALAIGLVVAVWAGMAIVLTLEDAMNDIWDVPARERPALLRRRARALVALPVLGLAIAASAGLTTLGRIAGPFGLGGIVTLVGGLALNVAVVGAAFRSLTVARLRWRDVLPGAAAASVLWMILLQFGSWLIDRQLRHASDLYGFFAIVLGLLSWIALGARILLLSAELNVVLARRDRSTRARTG